MDVSKVIAIALCDYSTKIPGPGIAEKDKAIRPCHIKSITAVGESPCLVGTEKAHGQAHRMAGIEVPTGISKEIPLIRA